MTADGVRISDWSSYVCSSDLYASDEVTFIGSIYESDIFSALRLYSRAYVHGHRVGGTNPSLVEALGAGCAVVAHDNPFNRWVAGAGAVYFSDESQCSEMFDRIIGADADKQIGRAHV